MGRLSEIIVVVVRDGTISVVRKSRLEKQRNVDFMNGSYFSGGGALLSTAEDYLQFGVMLMQGGHHPAGLSSGLSFCRPVSQSRCRRITTSTASGSMPVTTNASPSATTTSRARPAVA